MTIVPLFQLFSAAWLATAPAGSDTLSGVVPMRPIEVSTARAADRAPVTHSTLGRDALTRANTGQDTPMLLASLPGAYAYSDAGNGIGYSYLTLRGFPQRRISVLINGVPLNDPESHEVYWIDHPDLVASTSELQVTRGVGSALYGAAALGGSVSLTTAPMDETAHRAVELSAGAFGTRRLMLEGGSGALPGGWGLYARYSRIETDGYRDQSWSRLWSYAVSAQKTLPGQSWRVNAYGGPENTHLAYLAIPGAWLAGGLTGDASRDRRVNPLSYAGEQDHFFEPHYELLHTWAPSSRLTVSQTLFAFDGTGYYDEFRTGQALADYRLAPWATSDSTRFDRSDYATNDAGFFVRDSLGRAIVERFAGVRRREVTNRHFGWVPRARLAHPGGELTLGGELRFHDSRHVGRVVSGDALSPGTAPDQAYYDYHPRTLAAGVFAREEWRASDAWRVTADLAWRHQGYAVRRDKFDGVSFDQHYDFALPRLGLSWANAKAWSAYASYAYANREPALRDLYDGEGVGGVPLIRRLSSLGGGDLLRPEHAHDVELGGAWVRGGASLKADVYRMDFRDELVYAGQFDTDLGYPILGNAAASVHQGLELEASFAPAALAPVGGSLALNATVSDNHFVRYREQYAPGTSGEVRYDGKPLGFFPANTAQAVARIARAGVGVGATARYVGRIFVDNTGTDANSIAPQGLLDLDASLERTIAGARATLTLRVANALDARYATSGYLDVDPANSANYVPYFVPAATRAWQAGLRVAW